MRKKPKFGILFLLLGVLLLALFVLGVFADEKLPEVQVTVSEQSVKEFSENLRSTVIQKIGQPIEGFTPDMFMRVYPGIKEVDFEGVEAQGGAYHYTIEDDVVFEENDSGVKTSADEAITDKGMGVLLSNIATRLKVDFSKSDALKVVMEKIQGKGLRDIYIENTVTARIGHGAFLYGVEITPVEVLTDSRCPVDVECVQTGTVRILAKVKTDKIEEQKELSLGETLDIGGVGITFTDVFPEQTSGQEIEAGGYEFEFQIEKK